MLGIYTLGGGIGELAVTMDEIPSFIGFPKWLEKKY